MPRVERYAHDESGEFVLVETVELTPEQETAEREAYLSETMQAINGPALLISLDHENRVRALEGQPPLTQESFLERVKTLMP